MSKRRKYGNVPTEVDGRVFASRREATRYAALRLMEKAGEIRLLECQPRYRIDVLGVHVCDYVGDFRYYEANSKRDSFRLVVEDCKSEPTKTAVYRLKKKLMAAVHGIEVREA